MTLENFKIAFEKGLWAVDSKRKKEIIKSGDRIAVYVKRTDEFRGAAEIVGEWYIATKPIWHEELKDNRIYWPWQVQIQWLATGKVNAKIVSNQLSFVENKDKWNVYFMGAPANFKRPIPESDFTKILSQIQVLGKKVEKLQAQTVKDGVADTSSLLGSYGSETSHTEIQHILIKLGRIGGCEVWVPRADRAKSFNDEAFSNLTLDMLPRLGFPEKVSRIVENIDVLWLKEETVLAAFEIEHTTSIFSGLLRMSDLVAVLPNVRFPLFIVVPEERKQRAKDEIMRPTFERLSPPLSKICKVLTYDNVIQLQEELSKTRFPPTWNPDNVARLGEDDPNLDS